MRLDQFMPSEAISSALRVVIRERSSVLVEQHCGIIAYTTTQATIRLRQGYLQICGEGLQLSAYTCDDICVSGQIKKLEFMP